MANRAGDWFRQAHLKPLPNSFERGAPTDFYTRKDAEEAIRCAEKILARVPVSATSQSLP